MEVFGVGVAHLSRSVVLPCFRWKKGLFDVTDDPRDARPFPLLTSSLLLFLFARWLGLGLIGSLCGGETLGPQT